ncbi:MAG: hypothetical protein GDA49_10205 [Rhodospirillales bacterium]|nr:hypothetical protein [Rhodospirillales bacterium]
MNDVAMVCGGPVVLTGIRDLWSPGLCKDGEHCLPVPPTDPQATAAAVAHIQGDAGLAASPGEAARQVTLEGFPLKRMDDGLESPVRMGGA